MLWPHVKQAEHKMGLGLLCPSVYRWGRAPQELNIRCGPTWNKLSSKGAMYCVFLSTGGAPLGTERREAHA